MRPITTFTKQNMINEDNGNNNNNNINNATDYSYNLLCNPCSVLIIDLVQTTLSRSLDTLASRNRAPNSLEASPVPESIFTSQPLIGQ